MLKSSFRYIIHQKFPCPNMLRNLLNLLFGDIFRTSQSPAIYKQKKKSIINQVHTWQRHRSFQPLHIPQCISSVMILDTIPNPSITWPVGKNLIYSLVLSKGQFLIRSFQSSRVIFITCTEMGGENYEKGQTKRQTIVLKNYNNDNDAGDGDGDRRIMA